MNNYYQDNLFNSYDDKKIEGEIENIIFENEENGYAVFTIIDILDGSEIVCTGIVSKVTPGETVRLYGKFVDHPDYGPQFNISSFERTPPITKQGMAKYLASGVIYGVGEKTAASIVSKFGDLSFEVIENYPEKLAEIRGISLKRAYEISEMFHERKNEREIIAFLQSYGITPGLANKIYENYGDKTVAIIEENPYKLADDISGIGFKTSDIIANKLGIEFESKYRIKSGILYTLRLALGDGHTYLPKDMLMDRAKDILKVDISLIENALMDMQIEKTLIQENLGEHIGVFLNSYNYAENYIAKKLLELTLHTNREDIDMEEDIEEIEESLNIELAENQKIAIREALKGGVLVITGGPGTGKTTTLNAMINLMEKEDLEIALATPTGRATKKMSETTNHEAKTIHRLLEVKYMTEGRQGFEKDEDNPIEADIIIIDEVSMVDCQLMSHLLRAISLGTTLILVGDSDQLPSVGAGNVLKDIIASNVIKTVRLDEIFRQAQKSHIVTNAHRINNGEYPVLNSENTDFFLVKRNTPRFVEETILDLMINRLPNFKDYDTLKDMQVLTPMKKGRLGTIELNKKIQGVINPPKKHKKEFEYRDNIFRVGDKVMQTKNNYNLPWVIFDENNYIIEEDKGIFNGDEGVIKDINTIGENMIILFDDNKVIEYPLSNLDELDLGYAITIHKSQGSEYKLIIMPVLNGPPLLLNRNLLYTAITRAKEMVVLVGTEDTINFMVDNNREVDRYSSLDRKIEKFSKLIN